MELAIVLVIALVIFGPKRLPELGQSLGKGMREFKNSISGDDDDDDGPSDELQKELTAQSPATTADPPDEKEEEAARAETQAEVVSDDRA